MTNGAGTNYNLTTWHGISNFTTLTQAQVRADILKLCLHDGTVILRAADFNLNKVQIDDTSINETIQAKILKLGFKQICASVLQQLCLGYSDQPHAAIEHIRQSVPGPDGQLVTATTIVYYQRMLNAARPFATQHTYAISVCNKFIQGLDARILGPFCRFYPGHSTVHDLCGAYQRAQLPIILAAAQAAKDEVKQMQDIACGMLGQGFYSNVIGGGDAPAFASQAEKTLSNYKGGEDQRRKRRPLKCFGCGGDHSWMKDKKVVCPNSKDPANIRCAANQYKKYKERITEHRAKRGGNKRRRVVDFKDMTPADQKQMREAVHASYTVDRSPKSSIPASTSASAATTSGPAIFMITVPIPPVLQNAPARRIIPVPIQAALPHITL
jgi:hypothetical protein